MLQTDSLYIASGRTLVQKTLLLLLLRACLLGFPRDRYPASPLARWLLPSNGCSMDSTEKTLVLLGMRDYNSVA
jgi:hypothetical protein